MDPALSIDDANSDDNFDPLANQTVSATTTDDDVAGFTIVESSGSTSVAESGTTDTFTVVLDAEPDSNVVILVSSGDTGEATVNASSLTFIPASWNTAQTVTGVDDNLIDGNQNTTITLSIDDTNSDDNFDPLANQTVNATTTDDDVAGFTIVESSGSTSVAESGTTDTFTVVLDAEPDSNVVILVSSGDTGEATVNVSSLTFIPASWNTAQTVTVTGVDDNLVDGNQNTTITLSIDDVNSDDNFDPLANQTVSATTTDDDAAGFTVVESSGSTSVSETGTTDTFTVVLDAEPDSNVVILVSSGDTGEATVNVSSLTFIPASWNTAQTVTVTGVDDNLVDGNQNTTITLSIDDLNSDDNFDPLANQTVSATTTDDDAAGFSVVESGGSTSVAESGTTDTFTVVLDAEPDSNVVILVSSGDTGEATVNVSSLTFIPASWNTAQTVTVTGVDDNLVDGSQNTTITLSIDDANSDDNFDPLANQTVSATTTDDDAAGFSVVESSGSTSVSETGTTDTFTVVLDAEPDSNVVILVSSGDTGEATVNVSSLTFIPAAWNTAQTVTVTGVDDNLVDGSQNTTITLSIDDANSDYNFDPLANQTVSATTTDDDAAGFSVVELSGSTSVSETGTTDTFTVVLDAEPDSNVVILVSSGDTGEATVNVSSLTFIPAAWNTAQTVTVTGVDDNLIDGSQNTTITLSIDDLNSDDNFDPLANQTVSATTTDDDAAGFSVVESSGSTSVSETGTTDTFTVVLDAEPDSNVVILISSGDTGEATVNVSSLTFIPAAWNTAQTVTVTGVDDNLVDGSQNTTITLSIDDVNSDDNFDPLANQTVSATTTDDDAAGFAIVESGGSTPVAESGTTDTFTVVLDAEPDSNVVILVSSGDTGEATVNVSSLTFIPASWNTAQTVTVTGVDDNLVDGNQNTTITLSIDDLNSDDNFDPLANQTVSATTTDDDAAGFSVVESSGSTSVSETGTTDTFTVVLDAEPDSNVVILVSSADTGEATVNVSSLTFIPVAWNTAQTVTVTGVDDNLVDGSQNTTITLSIDDVNSDDNFDPLANQTVSATTTDDDAAGFSVVESSGSTSVSETGTTDTFTVVLDAEPDSNVVILVSSADTGEATVNVASLTFTPITWSAAQTVTVTGVDDNLVDGNQNTTITLSIDDASSDDNFDPLANQTVSATTTDDDAAGFSVVESSGSTSVSETGTTDTFTVVLDAEPDSNVVILVSSGDTGEATVNVSSLTFIPASWNTAQTVTVTGVDDNLVDGNQDTTITLSIDDTNSDDNFDPLANQAVSATTTDDDAAGFSVVESSGSTSVSETGTTDTFTVVLDAEPDSNVMILVSSGDTGEATVDVSSLTFTPATWNAAQPVTVTGVDDTLVDGDQSTTITLSVDDANSDDNFDPLANQTVSATTTDDDAAGFSVAESGGSTSVSETGTTDTFTVVLDAEPDSNVVILVSSGDTGEATVDVSSLTFTPATWNAAQPVTVTGVDDSLVDGSQNTTITLSVDDTNSDDNFDPLANQTVSATTTDDDAAGFSVAESGGSTSVSETGTTDTFTVVLDAEPDSNVVILVSSGDTGEATVDVSSLTFTPATWNAAQPVTVTGVDDTLVDGNQNTTITLSIDDTNSDDNFDPLANQTVSATTTDDDAAGFSVAESGGSTSVSETGTTDTFTVVLDAEPASNVVILVSSADTGEATVNVASLTFTPVTWNAAQTVTVTGVDDTLVDGDQSTTITLSVDDTNSDDNFDPLANQTVNTTTTDDDAAGFSVAESGGSTSVSETGTTDTFTVVLDAEPASNVVILVSSADNGEATVSVSSVTFTPITWNAAQPVTVTGVDDTLVDGDQSTTITLSVDDANSDDNFDPLANQTVNTTTTDDDAAGFSVVESSGSTSVSETGTTDTFTAVLDAEPDSNVVILVSSGDTGEATVNVASLTFTPVTWNAAQPVTVTGVDDTLVDGDQSTTITLSVDDANSDDNFDLLADQTVSATTTDDDAAGFSVVESGGSTSVAESGTTDTFTVVLSAEPESNVVITVASGDTGEATVNVALLMFTPITWNAAQTVTVTGVDDTIVDGDQSTTITLSVDDANSDDNFDPLADQTVSATTTDDDMAGFSVVESGGSTSVAESGTTDTFTVVLNAEPESNVVITVTSGDTGEGTVNASSLTFTPVTWNAAQTVTVTGVDDTLVDGDQSTTVTLSVDDANSDDNFDPLANQTVNTTTTDDDAAGFSVVESSGSTSVSETGTTDTFTVVLDAEPDSNVVILVSSADTGEATVNVASLTFTPITWNAAQTVTVTGVDDSLVDGDQNITITLSIDDANSDDNFDPLADQTVSATTTDDDAAGFSVVESGGSTSVAESGTTDTFTVVLSAEPESNVVITVASGDTGEATVNVASLTFTPVTWNAAQVVTVTGVDDDLVDGDQITTVTLSIDDANSDDNFDPLADQTISATTTDGDVAGFSVVESDGSTSVEETGTTDTFSVSLTAGPTSDVVISVSSTDPGEATVDRVALTFMSSNWNVTQVVTVSGVADDVPDGDQTTIITLSVDDAGSDDSFDPLADQTVSATTIDQDGAGFSVVESDGSTSVDESGTADTVSVVLDAEPPSDVVIVVNSADPGEATVDLSALTFTPANWGVVQIVTVTGADDDILDGDQNTNVVFSIDDANSADSFDQLSDQTISVSTIDDDAAGFALVQSDGSTEVDESGKTDEVTVQLTGEPGSDVVISVTSADTGEVTVSPVSLTFGPGNWNVPQQLQVTGVDDTVADQDQIVQITLSVVDASSDDAWDAVPDQTVSATNIDDDPAGFTVTESSGSTRVDESGTTDRVMVALKSQPSSNVVVLISTSDPGEAEINPGTLTFTPANWNVPQQIIVTGVDDDLVDGSQTSTLTLKIDDSKSDDAFDSLPEQTINVTVTDDDEAGLIVSENGGSTEVEESGTTDTFTVVLRVQPQSPVVLDLEREDHTEVRLGLSSLTFTPANWNVAQRVVLTGVDDTLADGDKETAVYLKVDDTRSDDVFDSLSDEIVTVTTIDDETPGFRVEESEDSTEVDESGATDTFSVVLEAQPELNVVLKVSSEDGSEVAVDKDTLVFTTENWNVVQQVTVSAVDDDRLDGFNHVLITVGVLDESSADPFDDLPDQQFQVTTRDNDVAGFSVIESGGSTQAKESGETDTFAVVLDAGPDSNVVIKITNGDHSELLVTPGVLTFTPETWSVPQPVTVEAVDDDRIDGEQTPELTLSVDDLLSSSSFHSVADQVLEVRTIDDDLPGFTIRESDGSTQVDESGSTDLLTVVLDARPESQVVITVVTEDPSEVEVGPASLTFTNLNWNRSQIVRVTGVSDDEVDGDQTTSLILRVDAGRSDDAFDTASEQTVEVTTEDVDTAGFTVVESEGSSQVSESGTTDTLMVSLDGEPEGEVVIGVRSADPTEVSVTPTSLSFGPGNWAQPQIVTVTGVDDEEADGVQMSGVVFSVDDARSHSSFHPLPDQTVQVGTTDDDTVGFTVTESGGDTRVEESNGTDVLTVALNREPPSRVVLRVSSSDLTEAVVSLPFLTFTPANWAQTQAVTVIGVDDDVVDGDKTNLLTIGVDDALSDDLFDPLPDLRVEVTTLDDDTAGVQIASDGSGAAAESGGTYAYDVVLTARPSSSVSVTIDSDDQTNLGNGAGVPLILIFSPAQWATGQRVTVVAVDDDLSEGEHTSTIRHSSRSNDPDFDRLPIPSVVVTITDDDNDKVDLRVVKLVDDRTPQEGQKIEYSITVTNQGPADASQVTVSDYLPAGLVLGSVNPSQGSFEGSSLWKVGSLINGQTATLTLEAEVESGTEGQTIVNVATVVAVDEVDSDLSNNSDNIDIVVGGTTEIDLSITQDSSSDSVAAGGTLVYTLEIQNQSSSVATGVKLDDLLPPEVYLVSAIPSQGACSSDGRSLQCAVGKLSAGGGATIQLVVKVAAHIEGTITNTAAVSGGEDDPDLSNNTVSAEAEVDEDSDGDGITNRVEDAAPHGGDANRDGVADSQQSHIVSLPNAVDASYVTLASPEGTFFSDVLSLGPEDSAVIGAASASLPEDVQLPLGLFDFSLRGLTPGGQVEVGLLVHSGTAVNGYYKLGPTPESSRSHWYPFNFDGSTGAEVDGSSIVLHFTDGELGDDDLSANGHIRDAGGPALLTHSDLSIISTGFDHPAQVGDSLTCSFTIANYGPAPAKDVILRNWLDQGLDFASSSLAGSACSGSGESFICRLGNLAPGDSINVEIELDVTDTGTLTHTAQVSAAESDPNEANNRVELEVQIVAPLIVPASVDLGNQFFEDTYVGVALMNPQDNSNMVSVEVRDAQGIPLPSGGFGNALPTLGQNALRTEQIVDLKQEVASLIAQGEQGDLQGFFMVGDYQLRKLDGLGGQLQRSTELYFSSVVHGNEGSTLFFLFNPAAEGNSEASFRLFDSSGYLLDETSLLIAPSGTVLGSLADVLGRELEVSNGFVKVIADSPLQGAAFRGDAETISALPGRESQVVKNLIAPHFFFSPDGDDTEIHLLNVDYGEVTATIKVVSDNEGLLASKEIVIGSGELRVESIQKLVESVSTPPPGEVSGYLLLEVTPNDLRKVLKKGARVIGSVSFNLENGKVSSSLPLVESGQTETLYLQVAQSSQLEMFTGFAILNTGEETSRVTIQAFDEDGVKTAEREFDLPAGERQVGLLNEDVFFGPDFEQVKGHVKLLSSHPVVTFALFGDTSQRFLSAIEGQEPLR